MKMLVTGSAGFIGYHLACSLLKAGHEVVGLDSLINGDVRRMKFLKESAYADKFEFYSYDLLDMTAMKAIFKNRFECVFHLAALGSVPRSIADPLTTVHTNIMTTANVLWLSLLNKAERVVYSSSSSVYGDCAEINARSENRILNPINPYATSKMASESLAKGFWKCYKLPTISLRYFNVFGPGQAMYNSYPAVIPTWLAAFKKEESAIIFGDGYQRRDFTYVDNVVQANIAASEAGVNSFGEEYNVGCGKAVSLNEMFEMLSSYLHFKTGKTFSPIYKESRIGDVVFSLANIQKAKAELGYEPEVFAEEGIRKTVDWFLEEENNRCR